MKTHITLAFLLAFIGSAVAEEQLTKFDWKIMQQTGQGAFSGGVVTTDGKSILQMGSTDAGLETTLLVISNPPISKNFYGITGQIKYEDVAGDGYLEMWSFFPPVKPGMSEGKFFSRTLSGFGDMRKIHGTSNWRPFSLPFNRTGASGAPTRLQVNLVLPGKGTVYLSPLKLMQYESDSFENASNGGWWSDRGAGLIGWVGGTLIGCFGALLGLLANRGKGRAFVVTSVQTLAVVGVLLIVAGIVALGLKQPYAVWFLLLLGGIILSCQLFQLPSLNRRYDELELRRMNSMDAMAS